ncbi:MULTISPECIES: DUF3408 domain-containing protein [Dysgonomonas]|uniref:DUF3408 domain-containing protein n=1 Tax=Dysgonomonas TaxID=156973 RepID=UPI0009265B46|nr:MULTISPECIES: DUF3408 domain-containing protein [Dysgonomonas]MBN9300729.1 DUF3408 domain-containing protein [Dysgonomonas mossii]OJX59461.1 MAG: hypothetical protein BGO84_11960 [Dysgonomonas sp. 37-18]
MENLHQSQQTVKQGQSEPVASDKPEYRSAFIERSTEQIPQRKCVYIKADLVDIISRLAAVKPGLKMSIGAYISTVLEHHLESHREEIEHYYKENIPNTLL